MSRNSRRAAATAVAGVFAVAPLVSGCAAGQHPQSALPTQLAEGVNASAHQVDIRNTFILGPQPGQRLAAGSSAPIYAWFVNHGPADRLVAAEAPGVAGSVRIAGGALDLPTGKLVNTVETQSPTPTTSPTATPTPTAAKPKSPSKSATPGAKASTTPGTATSTTPGAPASSAPPVAPPAPSSKLILTGLAKTYSGGETVRLTLHFQQGRHRHAERPDRAPERLLRDVRPGARTRADAERDPAPGEHASGGDGQEQVAGAQGEEGRRHTDDGLSAKARLVTPEGSHETDRHSSGSNL